MNDTEIVNWIERRVMTIGITVEGTVITWLERGKDRRTVGDDLRDAVRKANSRAGGTE